MKSRFDTRDHKLDLIKGFACLLMIFAHAPGIDTSPITGLLYGENNQLVRMIYIMGEFAPVFFFTVSGVVGYLQAKKYPPRSVLLAYIFLFLLGFSYNGITQIEFYQNFQLEIIQIIAIGAFAVYLIQFTFKPPINIYFLIGIGVFALKFAGMHIDLLNNLLSFPKGIILPPGAFPILPWLFLFFFGAFAYFTENRNNLILAGGTVIFFIAMVLFSLPLNPTSKWDMSVGNFLLCSFLVFVTFYLVRRFDYFNHPVGKGLFLFWGQYSLLFLFIHKSIIRLFHTIAFLQNPGILRIPFFFWSAVAVITTIIMFVLVQLFSKAPYVNYFSDFRIWIVLVTLILIVPAIVPDRTAIYLLELLFGIIFSLYYPQLRTAVNRPELLFVSMKKEQRANL